MSKRIQSGHCTDALCLAVRTNAFLKTKMCPRLETCSLGKNCSFAHSDVELRPLPEFRKTAICYNYRRGKCINPGCRFAHGDEDMMGYIPPPAIQTRKICPYFLTGSCKNDNCAHAHMQSRRGASRLKTFLIALRNALSGIKALDNSVLNLKKKLKGGIPWQSLGFSSFKETVLFLPGTSLSFDDEHVIFEPNVHTRDLIQNLQSQIDSYQKEALSLDLSRSSYKIGTVFPPPSSPTTFMASDVIRPDQVIGEFNDFFTCAVCEGVSIDPVMTTVCCHVMCTTCWDIWKGGRSGPIACPKCQSEITIVDNETTAISGDNQSHSLAAALSIIYDSICVRCDRCLWTGSPKDWTSHLCIGTAPSSVVTPKSGTLVAVDDFYPQQDMSNVLGVKSGDIVELSAETESGWAFVTNKDTLQSGWTPTSFLTREPSPP
jgi:hypothetical protein